MKKIMVTGATGPLGSAVIDSLIKRSAGAAVAALVRNAGKAAGLAAKGVEVRMGDYDDEASLVRAFKGVDALYFVSGNDISVRMTQHERVVRAAREAGVRRVVYTSFQHKDETEASPIAFVAKSHLGTEQLLKASGLIYTILQHGIYTDMIPVFAGPRLLETKTLYQPAGNGRTAFAVRTDMADAGANVMVDTTGRYDNKTLTFTGAEAVSYFDVAGIISQVTGLPIAYQSPSLDEFNTAMTAAGVPAEIIGLIAGFATAIRVGEFDEVTEDLEKVLARRPQTVAQFLASAYGVAAGVQ